MKIIHFVLLIAATHSSSLLAAARQCPKATAFLQKTTGEAKRVMNAEFSSNWSISGPICSSGYSSFMTDQLSGLCNEPAAIDRVIVHGGSSDEKAVTAVSYMLTGKVSPLAVRQFIFHITGEEVAEMQEVPAPLAPLLRSKRDHRLSFGTSNGKLFASAYPKDSPDQTQVVIYDLRSISNQLKEFNQCLRDLGFLE
jgi:hypothetical protein